MGLIRKVQSHFGSATDCSGTHWEKQPVVHTKVDKDKYAEMDDRRYEAALKLASDRRWIAIFFAGTTVAASAFGVWQSQRPDVETQWLAYDSSMSDADGNSYRPMMVTKKTPDVPAIVMQKEATHLIKCAFRRSFDPNVNADCRDDIVAKFKTADAKGKLWEWARNIEGDGKERIVRITSQPRQVGTDAGARFTWRAAWQVEVRDQGRFEKIEKYEGDMTFSWVQPAAGFFSPGKAGLFVSSFMFGEAD